MVQYIVSNEVLLRQPPPRGLICQSLITKDADSLHPTSSSLGIDLVTDHIQWLCSALEDKILSAAPL